jgi:RNA polymerase sigma-70 factor (ECF subfamily)
MNEARLKLRRARRHLYESLDASVAGDEEGDYIPCDFADWREIPSEALENARLRTALRKALTSIGSKYQQVIVLRDVEHLSIAETANLLGISEAAVKTRLMRARLMMRDALAPGFDGAWKKGEPYQKVRPF